MKSASSIFGRDRALVGMVHVAALAGTPRGELAPRVIVARAVEEARVLADAGFDAIIIENMHDVPYLRREVGPEIVAAMTAVTAAVRAEIDLPLGVQILAGANRAALAVAHATGAGFIRAEGFVFAAVADEGVLDEADAGPLLRERRRLGAGAVRILADVKKKHSAHAMTADVDIAATAQAAQFAGADAVVVTGPVTGCAVDLEELACVREAVEIPVIVGSGVTAASARDLLERADALVVGSAIKREGRWENAVDRDRAAKFVRAARG